MNIRRRVQFCLLLCIDALVLLLATENTLLATVVPRLTFDELSGRASKIVHARFVYSEVFIEAGSGTIWTRNRFVILDTLKGDIAANIVVTEPGGIVGNQGQWVPGAPQFVSGDESVLFLVQTATGKWRVFGWGQGNYRVTRDALSGEAVVKPDLAGAEITASIGSSPESYSPSGFLPIHVETLNALKARIRNQLMKPSNRQN